MKILLVSQMYPGPDDPDLGVFVAQLEREALVLVVAQHPREAVAGRRRVALEPERIAPERLAGGLD